MIPEIIKLDHNKFCNYNITVIIFLDINSIKKIIINIAIYVKK